MAWKSAYESDDVAGWVSETSAIYLAESAHLLRAFATLLRSHRMFADVSAHEAVRTERRSREHLADLDGSCRYI